MKDFVFIAHIEFDRDGLPDLEGPKRIAFSHEQAALDFMVGLALRDAELQPRCRSVQYGSQSSDGAFSVYWTDRDGFDYQIGMVYEVPVAG